MISLNDLLKFNNFGQREDPPSSIYLSKIAHDIDDLHYKIGLGDETNDSITNKLFTMYHDIYTLNDKIMQENRTFRDEIDRLNAVEMEYRKKQMRG